jgi:geranylgeranyl diphosphate synthase, type II
LRRVFKGVVMDIKQYLSKVRVKVDHELNTLVPDAKIRPRRVHQAIKHAIKGGKRIRPILCMACAETTGAKAQYVLRAACAIEMIHTYSLIHDDLPCMDDDDYRRGRQTVHKRFDIATAVLAGDALLTQAFYCLADSTPDNNINAKIIKILSHAAGSAGMIAGQSADIEARSNDIAMQEYINVHKTGALIAASCKIGAVMGHACPRDTESLYKFGEHIGLVFQITDDIIDSEGTSGIMGKKRAFQHAQSLTETAKTMIKHFKKRASRLCGIADFILNRKI